jgi:ABC-type bacteriocin/lantibiotic exporter with double-glycine peptidase domain
VVLTSSAGDDATAALTMILRYHRKPVTFDQVRRAIYAARAGAPNAGNVVKAAERFRLHVRGLSIDDPILLERLPMPNIAHMMRDRGQFPRALDGGLDGYFAVVVSISQRGVHWIDPYVGQIDDELDAFCEFASGIFLIFDEAAPLLRARLRSVASDG